MRILHLSDTHGCHRRLHDLPPADIVVHSGDFTMNGSEQEALDFMNWFCDLPHSQKIFICGNHDDCLYGATIDGFDCNVHYLCNSRVEIDNVKFYLYLYNKVRPYKYQTTFFLSIPYRQFETILCSTP